MARRTIAAARRMLEGAVLSDDMRRQYEAEINAAAGQAKAVSDRMLHQIVNNMQEQRDEVLADVCTLRDKFQALTDEGALGTLSAEEYAEKFKKLQEEKRTLARRERRLVDMAKQAEQIEADPEAYGDSLFAKFPQTQPDFTF